MSARLTGLVREEDFGGLVERGRVLLGVEQVVQHAVEDLLGARLGHVEHQLRLTEEVLDVDVRTDLGREVLHWDFLRHT